MAKRALIVGARDERPKYRIEPRPSVDAITGLLEDLGGWTTEVVEAEAASRAGILDALERLAAAVEPDDTILFYFFGHGGAVQFTDAPATLGDRPVFYICASRSDDAEDMSGVLDVELSAALAAIDQICGNVSVILDCCHSAQIVRDSIRRRPSPSWVRALELGGDFHHPAASHPRIVRLAGTSSLNYAFARRQEAGNLGLLTEGFVAVVREAGLAIDRLCWDSVAHRVREHAIQARRYEHQWVTLAGPRSRLLFGRETITAPRSVGFIADRDGGPGWLRAGLMQGVRVGDEWGIAALTLDEARRPQIRARVRVVDVDLHLARVEPTDAGQDASGMPDGSAALLIDAHERKPVLIEGSESVLVRAVAESALVRPAKSAEQRPWARTVLEEDPRGVRVRVIEGVKEATASCVNEISASSWAVEQLENWARVEMLLAGLAECPITPERLPVAVRWGRCDSGHDRDLPLDDDELVLREGTPLYFELTHRELTPETWYVNAVEIGVDGCAVLLDASEPDGRAIAKGQRVCFGRRARNFKTGRPLVWPPTVARVQPRPLSVVFLSSLRPIQLGHLVNSETGHLPHPHFRDEIQPGTRGKGVDPGWIAPTLSHKWAWFQLRFRMSPARAPAY